MYLVMQIGRMVIDRVEVDFTGLTTVAERESYLLRLRLSLERKHVLKVSAMHRLPLFYIDRVPSKLNRHD